MDYDQAKGNPFDHDHAPSIRIQALLQSLTGKGDDAILRKLIIGAIGGTFLVAGILMILLPGPALIFIPLGIAILATEFRWARRVLDWAKEKIRKRKPN